MTGDFAINAISQVHANKAIIGCSGFSVEDGMTTSVHREVSINQLMPKNCTGTTFLLADHTKLNHSPNYSSGSIADIDCLITDYFLTVISLTDWLMKLEQKLKLLISIKRFLIKPTFYNYFLPFRM